MKMRKVFFACLLALAGACGEEPNIRPGAFEVVEQHLEGKRCAAANEDGIVVTEHFAAVIDGATAKSDFTPDSKTTGRMAMEIVAQTVRMLPPDINAQGAMERITAALHDFYVAHNLLADLEREPGRRLTANGVIYSAARREVWQVGDCQVLMGRIYSRNEKAIDGIMSEARAAMIEAMLARGMSPDQICEADPGRALIAPFLAVQAVLQNHPDPSQAYAFPVFDGFPIRMEQVNIFTAGPETEEIVLASDGYPEVLPTLSASESRLAEILSRDPLCFREYRSTKGVRPGCVPFDDRAYLRIRLINRFPK